MSAAWHAGCGSDMEWRTNVMVPSFEIHLCTGTHSQVAMCRIHDCYKNEFLSNKIQFSRTLFTRKFTKRQETVNQLNIQSR